MKAFVLLSGGMDSTTALYKAVADVGAENVQAFSIYYGQRHQKEIAQAQRICQYIIGVRHNVLKLDEQPESMLTDEDREIPHVGYEEIKGVSPTYVWFRNGQLISRIGAVVHFLMQDYVKDNPTEFGQIYIGVHAEDAMNWAYPDCTPEFIGAMANAIYIGTYHQVRLVAPLQYMMKHEIVRLGQELGVPWDQTWSCYAGGAKHCGLCPTCRARKAAFKEAAIHDPTEYEG